MDPVIEFTSGHIDPTAQIGASTVIRARELVLGPRTTIGAGVTIDADKFITGHNTTISKDCTLRGTGRPAAHVEVGDNFFLGPSSAVLVPEFLAGDYVAIHNHLLCNGYRPCVIGHNTWIGQNCILNSTDDLIIGNNVGIGAYSSIYTHAYNGEMLEGCEIWNKAPVVIEDNAWLIGGYNVISPGVTIGSRGTVLTSSVVSRDVPPAHAFGGVPARDLTDRLRPFRDVSLADKLDMMARFIREFVDERHPENSDAIAGGFTVTPERGEPFFVIVQEAFDRTGLPDTSGVVYAGSANLDDVDERTTVFNLSTKQYSKRRTSCEVSLIGFMNGYRARFVPSDNPRLSASPTD